MIKKRLLSLLLSISMVLSLVPWAAAQNLPGAPKTSQAAFDTGSSPIAASNVHYDDGNGHTGYTETLEAAFAKLTQTGGTIYLNTDVKPQKIITIPVGKRVVLDLGGCKIDRGLQSAAPSEDGGVFRVAGELVIQSTQRRKDAPASRGAIMGGSSTTGGGVHVRSGGRLELQGGSITGNASQTAGGGIYNEGTVVMSGGSVTANRGGGVYQGGFFEVSNGAAITGNTAGNGAPRNVYLAAGKVLTARNLTGSTAFGLTLAQLPGAGQAATGATGSITDTAKFTSEQGLRVSLVGGQIKLGGSAAPATVQAPATTAVQQSAPAAARQSVTPQPLAEVAFNLNYEGAGDPPERLPIPDGATETTQYKEITGFPPVSPTRTGYHYLGWFTAQTDGTEVTGETALISLATHTLHAYWEAKTVEVTLDTNDGRTATPDKVTATFDKTYGEACTDGKLPVPTRTGYTFDGWYTEATGGTQVTDDSPVQNETNHTLYAHWTGVSVTVTLDENYGTPPKTSTRTVTYGSTYGASAALPTPVRTGYTFDGWYSDATGGSNVTDTTAVARTDAHTLYAHWTAKEVTVNFNKNSDGAGAPSPASKRVTYDQKYGDLATVSYQDHDFLGWFRSEKGGREVTKDTIVTTTAEKEELFALWKDTQQYKITLVEDDSAADAYILVTDENGNLTLPTLAECGFKVPDDKVFKGWEIVTKSREKQKPLQPGTVHQFTADQTLVAVSGDPVVTFHSIDETFTPVQSTTAYIKGDTLQLPAVGDTEFPFSPLPAGKTFAGWFVKKNALGDLSDANLEQIDSTYVIQGDVDVYAKWAPVTSADEAAYIPASPSAQKETGTFANMWAKAESAQRGTVRLLADVTSGPLAISSGTSGTPGTHYMTLDLNGHKLRQNSTAGSLITVNSDADFTVKDSSAGHTGEIIGNGTRVAKGGVVNNAGTFTLEDGKITGGNADLGGGVYSEGTFEMRGKSSIEGNTADYGGGAYLRGNQHHSLGGLDAEISITGNTANTAGGGMYITDNANDTHEMYVGDKVVISGNQTADGKNSDLHLAGQAVISQAGSPKLADGSRIGFSVEEGSFVNDVRRVILNTVGTDNKHFFSNLPGYGVTFVDDSRGGYHVLSKTPAATYTITYDANGGDGRMEPESAEQNKPFRLPSCDFTPPTGKTFKAWLVDSKEYAAGASITPTADTTVTAVWQDIPASKYLVTFKGGAGALPATGYPMSYNAGTINLPFSLFTREGYEFDGWVNDETGAKYAANDPYPLTKDTSFTAAWRNVSFHVTFDVNTADTAATVSPAAKAVTRGQVYGPLPTPAWPGHVFLGWCAGEPEPGTSAVARGVEITENSMVTAQTSHTIYALWRAEGEKIFRLTFRMGNNTGLDYVWLTGTEGKLVLPEPADVGFTAPTGMVFDAWQIETPNTRAAERKQPGETYEFVNDTVITALWKAAPATTYTIKFNANGGTGTMADRTVTAGAAFTLPGNGFTPPGGKVFDRWAIDSANSGTTVAAGDSYTFTADTTVYALWKDSSSSGGDNSGGGGYRPSRPPANKDDNDSGSSSSGGIIINANTTTGGSISPSGQVRVERGRDQTFTITPQAGYVISDVRVNGMSVGAVSRYTFEKVRSEKTIYVIFAPASAAATAPTQPASTAQTQPAAAAVGPTDFMSCQKDYNCPIAPYADAQPTAWYHDGVHYCMDAGLMTGTDASHFEPAASLTRGMLAQILYNHEGRPAVAADSSRFADVAVGAWYENAVKYAAASGLVSGYENGNFGPNDPVTREQLVAVLWRHAGSPASGISVPLSDFFDTRAFADDAMRWAYGRGIISGKDNGLLDPGGRASRAEVAQMLKGYFS